MPTGVTAITKCCFVEAVEQQLHIGLKVPDLNATLLEYTTPLMLSVRPHTGPLLTVLVIRCSTSGDVIAAIDADQCVPAQQLFGFRAV